MSHMALIASPLKGCHLLFGVAGWIICHISHSASQCPPIKSVVWGKKKRVKEQKLSDCGYKVIDVVKRRDIHI